MSFMNKVVIITGAASGMGAAAAILFAKEKANVVIVDINAAGAEQVKNKCEISNNRVILVQADVSKEDDIRNVIDKTVEAFGKIDVLVNNAGMVKEDKILDESILKTFDITMNVNLRSVVFLTTLAAPHLIQSKGCVVNTSSVFAIAPRLTISAAYTMSKVGIISFTETAAKELAPHGVRVNAVCPGAVKTSILENANLKLDWSTISEASAMNKIIYPEEVGDLILYLASDKAKSITGSSVVIDAGMLIK